MRIWIRIRTIGTSTVLFVVPQTVQKVPNNLPLPVPYLNKVTVILQIGAGYRYWRQLPQKGLLRLDALMKNDVYTADQE